MSENTLSPVGTFREVANNTGSSAVLFEYVTGHKKSGLLKRGPLKESWQTSSYHGAEQAVEQLVRSGRTQDEPALREMLENMERIVERACADDVSDGAWYGGANLNMMRS